MTVIVKNGDGTKSCFETSSYLISTEKAMHPAIVSVKVYSGTKLIAKKSRRFPWWYKHITFKSAKVQNELKRIHEAQEAQQKQSEENSK